MPIVKRRLTAEVGMQLIWTCPNCANVHVMPPRNNVKKGRCVMCGGEYPFDAS